MRSIAVMNQKGGCGKTTTAKSILRILPEPPARILGGSDVPLLRLAESIALTHHERWDGKGYPQGLRGEAIPIAARIVEVNSGGATDVNPARFKYQHVRRPLFGLEK